MGFEKRKKVDVRLRDIRLSEIDWEDDFFRISSYSHSLSQEIAASIASVGIINQPFVIAKGHKTSVVCGFKRLSACRDLELKEISVKQLDPKTPVEECAKIAIADNFFQRPLNLIEQSRSYALLESASKDKERFQALLSETGLSNNPSWIAKISPLCQLPPSIQAGIEKEVIPIVIAQMFLQMDVTTAVFLCGLFQDLTLGLNKQREIIQIASEIAKRDDLTLLELFHVEEIQNIIADDQLDKSKKTFLIRQWLKLKRYPHVSHQMDTFDAEIRKLKLGSQIRLTPPAYFEGKHYNLSLGFSTLDELTSFRNTIKRLEENDYLQSLLKK